MYTELERELREEVEEEEEEEEEAVAEEEEEGCSPAVVEDG